MGLKEKEKKLSSLLKECGSVLVAYSGGVDSTVLAVLASRALGEKCLAVTAISEIHSREESYNAKKLAKELGLRHTVIRAGIMKDQMFAKNPVNRCYICKKQIFSDLAYLAEKLGIDTIIDGSNADDLKEYRPGRKALKELSVKSPLAEAGLTKKEIRRIGRNMGIRVWNQPANPCLATRIPYHKPITIGALRQIEKAEGVLHKMGFIQCRVRHHGDLARIEIPAGQFNKALLAKDRIVSALRREGYRFVTLDLAGYQKGCYDNGKKDAEGKNRPTA